MSKLAINDGPKTRIKLFPSQNTMDESEINAAIETIKRGRLSGYRGNWCPEFMGGPAVQKLEEEWAKKFNVKCAMAVNSATSGLHVACGAIGLKPGDEVIVTPYSMTCSATAPMIYGATPVFADVEKDYYCLDPESVESRITKKTKAIIAVSIFGQPYSPEINRIAEKYKLLVIEDAAQAPGSYWDCPNNHPKYSGKIYTGTLGDIGVYSFNYGKHINSGEGGMIVTNNDEFALKCSLIRNHAEAVINGMPEQIRTQEDCSLVGFNVRMTELTAAVISAQLEKFDRLLEQRMNNVAFLNTALSAIPAIEIGKVRPDCAHSYYVLPFQWNTEKADGLHRDVFINAVKTELTEREGREGEGVPIGCGYIQPLYKMPLFRQRDKILNSSWLDGSCPVCEDLYYNKLFLTLYQAPNSTLEDMKDVANAFWKVWENKDELR